MKERERNQFDLTKVFYFQSRNSYTGSKHALRFRIDVADAMNVSIWRQPVCFELAEIADTASFALDEDGYRDMIAWLDAAYAATTN